MLRKRPNDARPHRAAKRRVGNSPSSVSVCEQSTLGIDSWHLVHEQGTPPHECRGFALHVESPLQLGSSTSRPFPPSGYGPCRRHTGGPKVLGGAILTTSKAAPRQADPEAPSSPTSEQPRQGTATFGTSAIRALTRMLHTVDEQDNQMSFEQQTLYNLCVQDLNTSSQAYSNHQTLHNGQQLLMDLKRMQNLAHKHLQVPGEVEHSMANIFVISQCLTSILHNPKNKCFGNAPWRCWCWAGGFAEDAALAWGRSHRAVRQYLSDSVPQLLEGLHDMHQVWAPFKADDQADAADFLRSLWSFAGSTFFEGRFFHRSTRGQLEEREQFPLNLLFPDDPAFATLDDLINHWADEGNGQYLHGSPGGLVLNLQRSTHHQGQWTKHHREVEIPTRLNIPFSEDGINVHYASYQIVAMVLHQGEGHENGHYQSILAIDNAYWLGDDETYPTPISFISPQQMKEISQVWLVLSSPAELVPDTAIEIAETLAKKSKKAQEVLQLLFGNVTFFSKKVQDWIWTKADTILMLQETHLQTDSLDNTMQYFSTRGWKCHGVAAEPTGNGGSTGGFITLHPARHLIHHVHDYTKQGNGWTALCMERQGQNIYLVQLYLRTGETLQSSLNADILGQLLHFLDHLQAPFIVGGDWQTSPEELAATNIPSKMRAQIVATTGPTTLQGSHLDFCLVSTSLASFVTLEADWEVPWKPHCALSLQLNCTTGAVPVQQLQRFPPIARVYQLPNNWTSYNEDDGPFEIIGQTITGLGSDFARWATQTEKYLCQTLQKPTTGRGSKIKLFQAPLIDSSKPQVWKKGSAAYWERMGVRINVAQHKRHPSVLHDLRQMLERLSQHASKQLDQPHSVERLTQWTFGAAIDPAELQDTVHQEQERALNSNFLVPPTMSSESGWKRLMTRASGASSEVFVKKTIVGNVPSRTFHTHRGFQLENSNGERSGNHFRPHATLEAFRSCDG